MNPRKVDRSRLARLPDLPNVGKATADDLRRLGVDAPAQLADACPFDLYARLCRLCGQRLDPCVLDVFISITRFMQDEAPRPWWDYTEERKRMLAARATD